MSQNILSNSLSWQLLKYSSDDPVEDAAFELAGILGVELDVAKEMVEGVLNSYHRKNIPTPKYINYYLYSFIVHLTQSYRIPGMTSRFDWFLKILDIERLGFIKNGLDYGGGGGKDTIILAKKGINFTYSDLLSPLSDFVSKRFQLRGLDVKIMDVRDFDEERFDLINCMDVLEHIYDLENALSDISSRLNNGGVLFIVPAFFNSWDGDHIEKNCAYQEWFPELAAVAGLQLIGKYDKFTYCFLRESRELISVSKEKEDTVKKLYIKSKEVSLSNALRGLDEINNTKSLNEKLINDISDNLAIYRLSNNRLSTL
jgi:SAM-dependent methyltransferase